MKFQDKFKPGDIICSDRFHNGLCMVVEYCEETVLQLGTEFKYKCKDFVQENQGWNAYESDTFDKPYNWRIATDDDIANYLARFLHIPIGKVGEYEARLVDNGVILQSGVHTSLHFNTEELVQLGKIINERVVG